MKKIIIILLTIIFVIFIVIPSIPKLFGNNDKAVPVDCMPIIGIHTKWEKVPKEKRLQAIIHGTYCGSF